MQPIVVRPWCFRTLGISRGPFHVLQESKQLGISYCSLNIDIRNEASRLPPLGHDLRNRNRKRG
jgi:hypothetical protein